jgi:NhaP-type Na+/H+ or K+/H+ antiporter
MEAGIAMFVLLLAINALTPTGGPIDIVTRMVGWTVLLSVVGHGLTASPLAARYGRWIEAHQRSAADPLPALEERSDLQPSARATWVRRA